MNFELIPSHVDGAVVFNLMGRCKNKTRECESCHALIVHLHNWLKLAHLEYFILDFQDVKTVCHTFLEQIHVLKRRLVIPMLFIGVLDENLGQMLIMSQNQQYPIFIAPEDAVRALRLGYPGVTEHSLQLPVYYGHSIGNWLSMAPSNLL